jgi:hypothetical protein
MLRAWALLAASAAVYAAAVAWAAWRLPADGVALHIGTEGVDRVGPRLEAVAGFVNLGVVLTALAALVLGGVALLPVRWMNVPHRDYWTAPRRAPLMRRMLAWDMAVLFSLPILFAACIPVDLTLATADPSGHPPWLFPVALGLLLAGMAARIAWMAGPRYRPAPDG